VATRTIQAMYMIDVSLCLFVKHLFATLVCLQHLFVRHNVSLQQPSDLYVDVKHLFATIWNYISLC
jgi:hypothetical protein